MSDGILIVLFILLLISTAILWLRLRHFPSMRPWLVRHSIGNFVLAVGLVAAWRYDLSPFYYGTIILAVFVMWLWGTWKLRHSAQNNK